MSSFGMEPIAVRAAQADGIPFCSAITARCTSIFPYDFLLYILWGSLRVLYYIYPAVAICLSFPERKLAMVSTGYFIPKGEAVMFA